MFGANPASTGAINLLSVRRIFLPTGRSNPARDAFVQRAEHIGTVWNYPVAGFGTAFCFHPRNIRVLPGEAAAFRFAGSGPVLGNRSAVESYVIL